LYGFLARKGRLPYVISKHGLLGAVRTLAIELAKYNILTNAVSPGYINTKMTTKNNSPEKINELVQGIPQRRLGKPEEIAKVVNFLVNDDNTYINGQDIVVDGGFSIGGFQK
jgi:3-oxoacyl-[acyl-carrier protein] reductase